MVARCIPCIANLSYEHANGNCVRKSIDFSKAKYGHRKSLKALIYILYISIYVSISLSLYIYIYVWMIRGTGVCFVVCVSSLRNFSPYHWIHKGICKIVLCINSPLNYPYIWSQWWGRFSLGWNKFFTGYVYIIIHQIPFTGRDI